MHYRLFWLALAGLSLVHASIASSPSSLPHVSGIIATEFHDPFLLIHLRDADLAERVKADVEAIYAAGTDKFLSKIRHPIQFRYYDSASYVLHRRELQLIEDAKSNRGFAKLLERSPFTSIYEVEETTGELTANRKTHHEQKGLVRADSLGRELSAAKAYLKRFEGKRSKPNKLICFSYHFSGVLVFPVLDGYIRVNGKKLSYKKFEEELEKLPSYQNPNTE